MKRHIRHKWEVYAEIINLCPMQYTRLIRAVGTTTKVVNECFDLGLIKREKTANDDSYRRKTIYMVHSTEKGELLRSYVRSIREMLRE